MKKLFYDGSCNLCQHEIGLLAPKLTPHLQLVDISQQGFRGFAGVSKGEMMQQIHLWDNDHFITGIDASLHYWRLAGYRRLVAFLQLAPCYWVASKAYNYWARSRANCAKGDCNL
ncbi:DUF393 domain-containing protein [Arsukibacterium sp.]|uniref:thiol-disulfide oxidoreductase DCC family protein n=1 Tax=Arsukibacterium sp. TaxID=1977258 RepID=UPI00299E02E5|nr:DUF393 domain-containing protein [Arsukibacterium sp.]MDX1676724.1 DUF393 domain-containing protein [Arsukibacterium sp.]